jgi:3',5'-cyclic AMP phosphodiesterase CpdA
MDDGAEADVGSGEVSWIPPGHDAWVVGDEPATVVDFQGAVNRAKGSAKK